MDFPLGLSRPLRGGLIPKIRWKDTMDIWWGLLIENFLLVRQVHEKVDKIAELAQIYHTSVNVCYLFD